MDDLSVEQIIYLLISKLNKPISIVDKDTGESVKVENGSLLISKVEKKEEFWSISFNDVIPKYAKSFFWYCTNKGDTPICFENFKFVSTVAGSATTNVTIHRIIGEPAYTEETSWITKLDSKNTNLEIDSIVSKSIDNIDNIDQLTRIDLYNAFEAEESDTKIILNTGESIGARWNDSLGAISGTIILSREE